MAEIEIQKKPQGGGPWPWVIGVLVLALVIWGVTQLMTDDDDDFATTPTAEQVVPVDLPDDTRTGDATAAARFRAWVRDSADAAGQMGRQHEYTREGIQRMSTALEGLVARDTAPEIQQRLQTLQQQRQQIRDSEPSSPEHAGQAKQAFTSAVEILERLQDRPHLQQANMRDHVSAARRAADRVQANTPLLDQRATVHEFFDHIAQALEAAAGSPGR